MITLDSKPVRCMVRTPKAKVLILGLTVAQLDQLRAAPCDEYLQFDGADLGLSHDVWILAGETREALEKLIMPSIEHGGGGKA